ncbi:uncharacterized protein PITG_17389 [Phytophthora infestans T30-4]|uniref:Uncharacterized protein n=1 Tax=Phytophthora infestans (strain T30-4) TaxID=403677 RepID=D0NVY6_PHYIT|nr:uncharacterized protein PITG_17389 [Phytophthora infestans T30-4]EEY66822.1 hypothetical protein PITG_17389 [Phytophthora infestans T30-4]|eukprot:XP_002896709.1 hypothetical protein PITG_17389 [Phytophthora infestans T30-4]
MTKTLAFSTAALLAIISFLLLNNAVDVVAQSTLLSTLMNDYDPLVLENINLGTFSYSILGLSIDATVSLTLEEIDASISVDVSLTLDKPVLSANVQVDMYGCAPGAPDCKDITLTTIEVAGVDGNLQLFKQLR